MCGGCGGLRRHVGTDRSRSSLECLHTVVDRASGTPSTAARQSPTGQRSGQPSASQSPTGRSDDTPSARTPPVVTVTVAGDVMLGRRVGDRLARTGDYADALRPTARRLASADITVGNLESTLSELGPPTQGGDSFGADPRVRSGLRLAGFDVLSLANNHTGDYGSRSLVETVRLPARRWPGPGRCGGRPVGGLAAGGRAPARESGSGSWRSTRSARPGAPVGTPPVRRACRCSRVPGPSTGTTLRTPTSAVRKLAGQVDVVIVLPHWGDQYTHRPVADQRTVGRALIDAGADAVVGGHPHWVQSAETYQGRPLVHSLGNFVFDMDWEPEVREGVVLELRFVGDRLASARFVPYVIGSDFAPRWVYGDRADGILADLRLPDRAPYRD